MLLTIVICTHNRDRELRKCLESLVNQIDKDFFVLVVNNCSTDNTSSLVQEFSIKLPNIEIIDEPKLGLSHARNRGYGACQTDWLIYLDDDALAFPDLVKQAKHTIKHFDFVCFGGIFHALHEHQKPRWYRSHWGTNYNGIQQIQELPKNVYASAGIMAIRQDILVELGGFRTDIGLIGKKHLVGEETNLQVRMRKKGLRIGFNPNLQIHHLVSVKQLSPWWFVRRWYVIGLSFRRTFGYSGLPDGVLKFIWRCVRTLFINSQKFFFLVKKDYFIQNFIIDFFAPLAYETGLWMGRKHK